MMKRQVARCADGGAVRAPRWLAGWRARRLADGGVPGADWARPQTRDPSNGAAGPSYAEPNQAPEMGAMMSPGAPGDGPLIIGERRGGTGPYASAAEEDAAHARRDAESDLHDARWRGDSRQAIGALERVVKGFETRGVGAAMPADPPDAEPNRPTMPGLSAAQRDAARWDLGVTQRGQALADFRAGKSDAERLGTIDTGLDAALAGLGGAPKAASAPGLLPGLTLPGLAGQYAHGGPVWNAKHGGKVPTARRAGVDQVPAMLDAPPGGLPEVVQPGDTASALDVVLGGTGRPPFQALDEFRMQTHDFGAVQARRRARGATGGKGSRPVVRRADGGVSYDDPEALAREYERQTGRVVLPASAEEGRRRADALVPLPPRDPELYGNAPLAVVGPPTAAVDRDDAGAMRDYFTPTEKARARGTLRAVAAAPAEGDQPALPAARTGLAFAQRVQDALPEMQREIAATPLPYDQRMPRAGALPTVGPDPGRLGDRPNRGAGPGVLAGQPRGIPEQEAARVAREQQERREAALPDRAPLPAYDPQSPTANKPTPPPRTASGESATGPALTGSNFPVNKAAASPSLGRPINQGVLRQQLMAQMGVPSELEHRGTGFTDQSIPAALEREMARDTAARGGVPFWAPRGAMAAPVMTPAASVSAPPPAPATAAAEPAMPAVTVPEAAEGQPRSLAERIVLPPSAGPQQSPVVPPNMNLVPTPPRTLAERVLASRPAWTEDATSGPTAEAMVEPTVLHLNQPIPGALAAIRAGRPIPTAGLTDSDRQYGEQLKAAGGRVVVGNDGTFQGYETAGWQPVSAGGLSRQVALADAANPQAAQARREAVQSPEHIAKVAAQGNRTSGAGMFNPAETLPATRAETGLALAREWYGTRAKERGPLPDALADRMGVARETPPPPPSVEQQRLGLDWARAQAQVKQNAAQRRHEAALKSTELDVADAKDQAAARTARSKGLRDLFEQETKADEGAAVPGAAPRPRLSAAGKSWGLLQAERLGGMKGMTKADENVLFGLVRPAAGLVLDDQEALDLVMREEGAETVTPQLREKARQRREAAEAAAQERLAITLARLQQRGSDECGRCVVGR